MRLWVSGPRLRLGVASAVGMKAAPGTHLEWEGGSHLGSMNRAWSRERSRLGRETVPRILGTRPDGFGL